MVRQHWFSHRRFTGSVLQDSKCIGKLHVLEQSPPWHWLRIADNLIPMGIPTWARHRPGILPVATTRGNLEGSTGHSWGAGPVT